MKSIYRCSIDREIDFEKFFSRRHGFLKLIFILLIASKEVDEIPWGHVRWSQHCTAGGLEKGWDILLCADQ